MPVINIEGTHAPPCHDHSTPVLNQRKPNGGGASPGFPSGDGKKTSKRVLMVLMRRSVPIFAG
eukprot:299178-Pelagomonas_calceolata.AAC.2